MYCRCRCRSHQGSKVRRQRKHVLFRAYERVLKMYQTTVKVDGLACGMCEGNVEDAILRAFPRAEKVDVSHSMGEVRFLTEERPDERILRRAIRQTGFTFIFCESTPYEHRKLFGRK